EIDVGRAPLQGQGWIRMIARHASFRTEPGALPGAAESLQSVGTRGSHQGASPIAALAFHEETNQTGTARVIEPQFRSLAAACPPPKFLSGIGMDPLYPRKVVDGPMRAGHNESDRHHSPPPFLGGDGGAGGALEAQRGEVAIAARRRVVVPPGALECAAA